MARFEPFTLEPAELSAAVDRPLANRLTLATGNLDLAREHIGRVFAAHRLEFRDGDRRLAFRHHYAALDGISINRLEYGASVTVDAPPLETFYLLQITLAGACEIACGGRSVALPAGAMLVMNPTHPYRKRWRGDCRQLILRIDRGLLERHLVAVEGRLPRHPVEFAFAPLEAWSTGAGLARLVGLICADLESGGGVAHRHVQAQVAATLAAVLLTTVPHDHSPAFDGSVSPAAPYYVRRAEDFIREHARHALTLDEVVHAAGVSERALHLGFRRFRDLTPMGFLKNVRLDLVRRELIAAAERGRTVTDVATSCGLIPGGTFARDYRLRFGESPSETLRRGSRLV
jgi:AraC-like DNA-binding protein